MLKPLTIDITWAAGQPALDLMDPGSGAQGGESRGVYLHVIRDIRGAAIASYFGKSEFSVRERQYEHFASYYSGEYDLFDPSTGGIVHQARAARSPNHDAWLMAQLARTEIHVGEVQINGTPASNKIIECCEGLIIQSRQNHVGGRIINRRPGSIFFEAFDRFEIHHQGAVGVLPFVSNPTVWDRSTRTIR